jgi:hypothetical protein
VLHTYYWRRTLDPGTRNRKDDHSRALHRLGELRQNTVESVGLLEIVDTDRNDHLLLAVVEETERTGVYGSERLLKERNPRSDMFLMIVVYLLRRNIC